MQGKPKLIIIGSSGHAKEVINVIEANQQYEIIGCLGKSDTHRSILGYPILSASDVLNNLPEASSQPQLTHDEIILHDLWQQGVRHAFIAIGDNHIRTRLYQQVKAIGFQFANAISETTHCFRPTKFGENILIMPGCFISANTCIGNNVIIGAHSYVAHDCIIRDHAHLGPHSAIAGNVCIETGVFLGIGSRVIPSRVIGSWSIIGAGSTVVTDIPEEVTAIGTPAKIIKSHPFIEETT